MSQSPKSAKGKINTGTTFHIAKETMPPLNLSLTSHFVIPAISNFKSKNVARIKAMMKRRMRQVNSRPERRYKYIPNKRGVTNTIIGGYMINERATLTNIVILLFKRNPQMPNKRNMSDKLKGMRYQMPARFPLFVMKGMLIADRTDAKTLV